MARFDVQTCLGSEFRCVQNVKRKLKPCEYSDDRKKALEEMSE